MKIYLKKEDTNVDEIKKDSMLWESLSDSVITLYGNFYTEELAKKKQVYLDTFFLKKETLKTCH